MKRKTLLFNIYKIKFLLHIKVMFSFFSIVILSTSLFSYVNKNPFLSELRPFFSDKADSIEDIVLSSKNLTVKDIENKFLKIDKIEEEFDLKIEKDKDYFFQTFNNAIVFELTSEIILRLREKLINKLNEILIAADYWLLRSNSDRFQDKIENKLLKNKNIKTDNLVRLEFLRDHMLKFLGKIDELVLILEAYNSDYEKIESTIIEAVFLINSFFDNNYAPGSLEYDEELISFRGLEKIQVRKIVINNFINIQALDLFYKSVLDGLLVPSFFKRNWLNISFVIATVATGSYFAYRYKKNISNNYNSVMKKISNTSIFKYKGDLNKIIYDDVIELAEKGYIPEGDYFGPNLSYLINLKKMILEHNDKDSEVVYAGLNTNVISRWFRNKVNDATNGVIGDFSVLSKKIPDFVNINYLILYRIILDGYDFIKYPALIMAFGLTSYYLWKKISKLHLPQKELIGILTNLYKIFIPYCGLNSNNNLSYKDRGLFVYWIDKITNIIDIVHGTKKIALIKLLKDLKSDDLSLRNKAGIIKLEQERLLFGV